jgi:hypothetical protein
VRVVSAPAYEFNYPDALALGGNDMFVANGNGNSVSELPA